MTGLPSSASHSLPTTPPPTTSYTDSNHSHSSSSHSTTSTHDYHHHHHQIQQHHHFSHNHHHPSNSTDSHTSSSSSLPPSKSLHPTPTPLTLHQSQSHPLPPFHRLARSAYLRFSLSSLLAPLKADPSNPSDTLASNTIILTALLFTSTASSLVLSIVATRLTHLSLATFPALEYLALTILGRLALNLGLDALVSPSIHLHLDHHSPPAPLPSLTWRQTVRYALPTALFGLLASWTKAEVAGRVGIGVWQALEVYASPIILTAIAAHPTLQPSSHTFVLASLLAFAVSLVLLSQPSPPAALLLGIISSTAQALSLVSLKTWLLSFPARGPVSALATAAPFGLLAIALPAAAHSAQRSVHGRGSLGVMPRLTVGTSTWLLIFVSLRAAERLLEAFAVSRLRSPVAITLLVPARNLIALFLASPMHIYVGLVGGHAALVVVYLLTLVGLWAAEPEVGALVGIQSPTATTSFAIRSSKPSPDHAPDDSLSPAWRRTLQVVSFAPLAVLLLLLLLSGSLNSSDPDATMGRTTGRTPGPGRAPGSLDLVFSYYNEPLDGLASVVGYVRSVLPIAVQHPRVIVYVKHPASDLVAVQRASGADEVVRLDNVGREGGTYLAHILRHYNGTAPSPGLLASPAVAGLADHTLFMQPDISWHWIAKPRMELYDPLRTGFLSLGPYLTSVCGLDGLGNGNYDRMRDIYVMFYETFCPPTGQLASYAGQFIVSRKRILRNSYKKYANLKALLEAPLEHWIHAEGGWFRWKGSTDSGPAQNPKGPQSPFLGHALERSWPMVFGCVDPSVAEICGDDVVDKEKCQCLDDQQ